MVIVSVLVKSIYRSRQCIVNAVGCQNAGVLKAQSCTSGSCKVQAQVDGQGSNVYPPTARHGTASSSQVEDDGEPTPVQQQQWQAQQQQQQQTAEQASPKPDRHLQPSTDVNESMSAQPAGLPDSVNAVLQQLLHQSRAPRLWQADEVSSLIQK